MREFSGFLSFFSIIIGFFILLLGLVATMKGVEPIFDANKVGFQLIFLGVFSHVAIFLGEISETLSKEKKDD